MQSNWACISYVLFSKNGTIFLAVRITDLPILYCDTILVYLRQLVLTWRSFIKVLFSVLLLGKQLVQKSIDSAAGWVLLTQAIPAKSRRRYHHAVDGSLLISYINIIPVIVQFITKRHKFPCLFVRDKAQHAIFQKKVWRQNKKKGRKWLWSWQRQSIPNQIRNVDDAYIANVESKM